MPHLLEDLHIQLRLDLLDDLRHDGLGQRRPHALGDTVDHRHLAGQDRTGQEEGQCGMALVFIPDGAAQYAVGAFRMLLYRPLQDK